MVRRSGRKLEENATYFFEKFKISFEATVWPMH